MGLNKETIAFLLNGQKNGVNFERTLTLGRQNLYASPKELKSLGFSSPNIVTAEELFQILGADSVDSIDASSYEGATIVHDLNKPMFYSSYRLENFFTAVCDFGTLEHIFNFPEAIVTCMEMVKVNGHLLIVTPANNLLGHGFYQFGPELFYRLLSLANGFIIERMSLISYGPTVKIYDVTDPAVAKTRMTTISTAPCYLAIRARKFASIIPASFPAQANYTAQWNGEETAAQAGAVDSFSGPIFAKIKTAIHTFPRFARFLERLRYSRFNKAWTVNNKTIYKRCQF